MGERTDNTTTEDISVNATTRDDTTILAKRDASHAKANRLYYLTLTLHSSVGLAFKTYRSKKAIYERETRALTASLSTFLRKTSPTRKTT